MRRPRRPTAALLLVAATLLAPAPRARAAERLVRVFDEQSGLAVSEIQTLAQDPRGFLWVGSLGGLFRFDGREMRHWAPDSIRHVVQVIAPGGGGALVVVANYEPLWRVSADGGAASVPGPDGRPIRDATHAVVGGDGALWVIRGDSLLLCRDAAGRWSA